MSDVQINLVGDTMTRQDQAEVLSDLLQAERAILWDARGRGAQLSIYGMTREAAAIVLRRCADDLEAGS